MSSLKYVNGKETKINQNNELDQYFTKHSIAEELFNITIDEIKKYEKNINNYVWLEPSVGQGCFFDLLPENRKIGIDIDPKRKDVIKSDYLKYNLPKDSKIIVIGNPPFGNRGVMALEFINHSFPADYICFILPMFFSSVGKGSIKYRVKKYNLIYQKELGRNAFYLNNGKEVDIKCVFQIWSKNNFVKNNEFSWYNLKNQNPFKDILELYTVSLAKNRECGKKWIFDEKADFYISSTYFKKNEVVKSFDEVKYKSGIAIKYVTKNKNIIKKLDKIFVNVDWNKYSSKATNSCRHIGKSHIYELLKDNNF
ncbi:SAM-dependent methyltransferase [Spiroplasma sp. SV19]|nr:hypothetical protein [Spiroplasma sp. SV19]WHQ37193.1 SAM-dependent methyltransferase [Spiroplasma sp. SV19]